MDGLVLKSYCFYHYFIYEVVFLFSRTWLITAGGCLVLKVLLVYHLPTPAPPHLSSRQPSPAVTITFSVQLLSGSKSKSLCPWLFYIIYRYKSWPTIHESSAVHLCTHSSSRESESSPNVDQYCLMLITAADRWRFLPENHLNFTMHQYYSLPVIFVLLFLFICCVVCL